MASIGQISYYFGIHRNTLRNLEARGMISTPSRTAGNFREYEPEDVASIKCYLDSRKNKIKKGELAEWTEKELAGHRGRVHFRRQSRETL